MLSVSVNQAVAMIQDVGHMVKGVMLAVQDILIQMMTVYAYGAMGDVRVKDVRGVHVTEEIAASVQHG